MNFLHTADWHLGQTFYQYDRYQEHQHFLEWLLQTIEKQSTDVLLISGDVFDTANPSVSGMLSRGVYKGMGRDSICCTFPSSKENAIT